MDEKEKELNEFSLEDILKEFGDPNAETQPAEDVRVWDNKISAEKITDESDLADTVRLDSVVKAVREQEQASPEQTVRFEAIGDEEQNPEETVRFEAIGDKTEKLEQTVRFEAVGDKETAESTEQTVRFTPVGGDAELLEEPPVTIAPEERVEPYSEQWEPDYEQPINDYVPQEPIVFRPKSRLHELKSKLIAGPEKRYYELLEQGLGKLQAAIFMNLVVVLLAAGSTAMYAFGWVPDNRIRLLVFGQFFAMLLSALFGSYQLMEGVSDLLHRRFSLNTLLVFSLAACSADAILCLREVRVPCCAAFCVSVSMSLWSAYQKRNTEMGQMDTMRKAVRLDSLVASPDYHEGQAGFVRSEGQVEDFMDTYQIHSGPDNVISLYSLIALLVSVGIGVTAGVMNAFSMGVQVFAASLLVAVPASSYIATSRPMALLERRLHKLGTVICGWDGVLAMSKQGVFPLTSADIFPAGTTKMNGVKFFGSRNPDEVVAYAAALITADGSGMAPLFAQLLDSRSGIHYEATGLRNYGNGGIGGEVNGEAVLAGTLSFMQEMGVEMPSGTRVNQAVYVAIDGKLSGVFAISFAKTKLSAAGLTTLCAYRGLHPVMLSGDFMLTEEFLNSRFGVNTKRIIFPGRKTRDEILAKQTPEGLPALALMTRDDMAGMAFAVTGARALRSACRTGAIISLFGGIVGLLAMLALSIVGARHLLTPANILLFELIWMVPGILVTEWTRSV